MRQVPEEEEIKPRGGAKDKPFNIYVMFNTFITFNELKAQNMNIAKIQANRDLDKKNVEAKMEDLKMRGLICNAIIVPASDAINEGLQLCDFKDPKIAVTAENADQYVVVVDGQHRLAAHLRLKDSDPEYSREFTFQYVPTERAYTIVEMLRAINDPGHTWSLKDYAHGASTLNGSCPTLSFIADLVAQGVPYSSAAKWAALNRKITAQMVKEAMNSEGEVNATLTITKNLEHGKRIFAAAKTRLGLTFVKPRPFVDWVIDTMTEEDSKAEGASKISGFFESLSDDQVKVLKKIKGEKGKGSKEELLKKELDNLYNAYQNKSE